ncbi:flagellar hook-basal body complex protein [Nitrospinota bacterium]
MGILGALFSGVSGLDVYSNSIEVIGNNIANSNTAGFKGSRAEFADILAQSLSGSVSGNQIGRGVQLSAVTSQFTQGSFESTSSGTDLAIDGSGFFIVRNADGVFYSRAGQFTINSEGLLVNARGDRVQGVLLDSAGNPSGTVQDINLTVTNSPPQATSDVNFVANLDASTDTSGSKGTVTSGGVVTDRFQFLSNTNEDIAWNDGVADRTADLIGDGGLVSAVQYSGAQVAAAIETALEATDGGGAAGNDYDVSYDSTTKKFVIKNLTDAGADTNFGTITLRHSAAASTASRDLGFSTSTDDTILRAATVSSDNQVQFNVVTGRNQFSFAIDDGFYVGTQNATDAGALTATVAVGAYTADEFATAVEAAINNADNASAINRVRAVRVTHSAGTNLNKFQISSQTAGADRSINIPSDSNAIDISGSSFRVDETNLGILGLMNLNDTDTFTITDGFNDIIQVDFDGAGGGGTTDLDLITVGGLSSNQVITATQLAAGIETALNTDPGGDSYTVTFDSTAKTFSITAAGGNGDILNINWTNAASTAAATLGFTADDNVAAGGTVTSDVALTTDIANRSSVILDGTGAFDISNPADLTSSSFSTSLTLFDSLGSPHSITLFFRKIGENIWEYNGTVLGDELVGPTDNGVNEQLLYGRLWFNESGGLDIEDKFVGPTNADSTANTADSNGFLFPRANRFNFEGGASQNQQVAFDFGTSITTDSSTTGGLDGVTQFSGSSAVINQQQNGFTTGTLQSIGVGKNGNISGQFTNGQTRDLARIVLANFNAPQGLGSQGSSLFSETQDSGQPIQGQATTAGFGSVLSNSVELSNVDIAEEFVKLIQEQQAFQANARVISTTEDLLDEVVNLTR